MSTIVTRRGILLKSAAAVGAAMLPSALVQAADVQRVRLLIDAGRIDIDLYVRRAPVSAGDFLKYVDRHCYDGGSFSRVVRLDNDHGSPHIDVVQGGVRADVTPWAPIAHETTRQTGIHHLDGTISIPRDKVGTGSGSEFFICVGPQPALDFGGKRNPDGQGFAAFGRVTAGMDLVRALWHMDASGPSPDPYTNGQMLRRPVSIASAFRVA